MPKRLKDKPSPEPLTVASAQDIIREHMRKLGAKGGKASGAKRMEMPQEDRRRVAAIAAKARWARTKRKPKKGPNK